MLLEQEQARHEKIKNQNIAAKDRLKGYEKQHSTCGFFGSLSHAFCRMSSASEVFMELPCACRVIATIPQIKIVTRFQ